MMDGRRLADCLAKAHVSGPADLFYLISRPVASAFDRVEIRSAKATRSVNVQTGLAEMKSGEGTLIAFATGPGQTALYGGSAPTARSPVRRR